jgi:hypothetical protein
MSSHFTGLLSSIPKTLRDELIESLSQVERNFKENRWEPSELNGGKLCEVVYSILKGFIDHSFPASASKPANMVDACKSLEQSPSSFPRSIRIQIPRMLTALYEIRNNRGVGHVGGDVDPNHMDAVCVLQMSKWIVSELIRVFHDISTEEASRTVDALSDRELILIWKINGKSRVLNNSLSMLDKTLVLLYGSPTGITESELVSSIEHSNPSIYRRDILRKAHSKRLLEYDPSAKVATISPLGSKHVEKNILA